MDMHDIQPRIHLMFQIKYRIMLVDRHDQLLETNDVTHDRQNVLAQTKYCHVFLYDQLLCRSDRCPNRTLF